MSSSISGPVHVGVSPNVSSAVPSRLPNTSASCWPSPDRPPPTSGIPPSDGADGGAAIAGAVEPASTGGASGAADIGANAAGAGMGGVAAGALHVGDAMTGGDATLAAAGTVAA